MNRCVQITRILPSCRVLLPGPFFPSPLPLSFSRSCDTESRRAGTTTRQAKNVAGRSRSALRRHRLVTTSPLRSHGLKNSDSQERPVQEISIKLIATPRPMNTSFGIIERCRTIKLDRQSRHKTNPKEVFSLCLKKKKPFYIIRIASRGYC